jgi:hypothetical protein
MSNVLVMSYDMDNPTAGFTNITIPAPPAGNWQMMLAGSYGLMIAGSGGIIWAPWTSLTPVASWITAVGNPMPNSSAANMPYGPYELGDGWWTFPASIGGSSSGFFNGYRIPDIANQFDRYVLADPLLSNGKKPFVRVI